LHNIQGAADVYKRSRAARGGGDEMLGGTRLRQALDGESGRAGEEKNVTAKYANHAKNNKRRVGTSFRIATRSNPVLLRRF
jgi:hypothetical protein